MRLSEISAIISDNIDGIYKPFREPRTITISGAQYSRVSHLNNFKSSIDKLESLNLFNYLTDEIKKSLIYNVGSDTIDLAQTEYNKLERFAKELGFLASSMVTSINLVFSEVPEDEVSVKLPKFQTFNEFFHILKTLQKAFEQAVYNSTIDGTVTIGGFEPGSRWINFRVGSQAAVTLIGSLVWAGISISNQINTNAHQEEDLKTKGLKNEYLSAVMEANIKQIDLLIQSEAELIYKERFSDSVDNGISKIDQEQVEKLKLSIKSFNEIISMGGEVHPALSASDSIKMAFPEKSPINLIESRTKQLGKNAGTNNDQ